MGTLAGWIMHEFSPFSIPTELTDPKNLSTSSQNSRLNTLPFTAIPTVHILLRCYRSKFLLIEGNHIDFTVDLTILNQTMLVEWSTKFYLTEWTDHLSS